MIHPGAQQLLERPVGREHWQMQAVCGKEGLPGVPYMPSHMLSGY